MSSHSAYLSLIISLLFLLLASPSLVLVATHDTDDSSHGGSGGGHAFTDFVPRELMCDAGGRICTHKISQYLKSTGSTLSKHLLHNLTSMAKEVIEHETSRVSLKTCVLKYLRLLLGLAGFLGFATTYGICVWAVFISNGTYSRAILQWHLPAVKRLLSGVHCWAMASFLDVAVAGHYLGLRQSCGFEDYNLFSALVLVHINFLFIERNTTKALLEKEVLEKGAGKNGTSKQSKPSPSHAAADVDNPGVSKEAGDNEKETIKARMIAGLNERINCLSSWSSRLNGLVLVNLTLHLISLGCSLQLGAGVR